MGDLSDLKTYIGLTSENTKFDDVLKLILANTELQLKMKLGLTGAADTVPAELSYVVLQVAVKRFNRRKNEGMDSYSQEGESITFNANDFDEFQSDIDDWKKLNNASVLTAFDPYRLRGNS